MNGTLFGAAQAIAPVLAVLVHRFQALDEESRESSEQPEEILQISLNLQNLVGDLACLDQSGFNQCERLDVTRNDFLESRVGGLVVLSRNFARNEGRNIEVVD